LGILITVSIGYASLVLGFSIEGSELAAILGWGVLRGIMRRTSIVENNINQTVASAVNGASAGMMFSVPALFILEARTPGLTDFNPYLMVVACATGGVLGIAFIIPLRKQMIDFNRLAYPGGIAVAAILKSPGAGLKKSMLLIGGAIVSAVVHLVVTQVLEVPHEAWHLGDQLGVPSYFNITFYLSMLTIGVGFLSGKGGLVFGLGGFICYWFLAPLLAQTGSPEIQTLIGAGPGALREELFKPAGIGILIGAAIGGVVAAFPLIKSAIKSMQEAGQTKTAVGATGAGPFREGKQSVEAETDGDEMPIKVLYAGIALAFVGLSLIAYLVTDDLGWPRAVAMALLGTLWIWIAGVIVSECLGRTNWSPLSGMTLIAVTILIFIGTGKPTRTTIIASVVVGAAICVAIAQAGDMMLDLKSGYLTGASPKKQQIGQFLATWLGPIIVMVLIFVLHQAYGLGSEKLPAPQGKALASMIEGVTGGNVPLYRYGAGAGLGLILALSGLGGIGVMIGLGFYMPFLIALTYTIGNVARIVLEKVKGHRWCEEVGIPVAAGLIVGEALVGVGMALVVVIKGAAGG
ncbi:MAG TPA: oligopeptide transporter OPT family protein, partial [Polyangiaceae bacterium]|nr:oligopeptide transporter OPT family protein [Polyangiaceae bacterium]